MSLFFLFLFSDCLGSTRVSKICVKDDVGTRAVTTASDGRRGEGSGQTAKVKVQPGPEILGP